MAKQSSKEIALEIIEAAKKYGFELEIRNSILSIHKRFAPGDNDAFVDCDVMYYSVLGKLPRVRAGSDWGTDGSGVGGIAAIKSGHFVMNRSGGSKHVLNQLKKLV